eukprot:6214681-Pleurochrysis_carterae.AAC.2
MLRLVTGAPAQAVEEDSAKAWELGFSVKGNQSLPSPLSADTASYKNIIPTGRQSVKTDFPARLLGTQETSSSCARRIRVPSWKPSIRPTWALTRLQDMALQDQVLVKWKYWDREEDMTWEPRQKINNMGDDWKHRVCVLEVWMSTELVRKLGQSVHVLRIKRSGTAAAAPGSRMQTPARLAEDFHRREGSWLAASSAEDSPQFEAGRPLYARYVYDAKIQELTYVALERLAEEPKESPIKRPLAEVTFQKRSTINYTSLKSMLRLAKLDDRRVAGDVFGVRENVLRHQPADVKRPIRDHQCPDYKCHQRLRPGTGIQGGVRVCQLATILRCVCDCRDEKGIMENIRDSTWGGDSTLLAVAVLDNVDVVIINGQAVTDAVEYLTNANGRVSSRQTAWCREVLPLLDRCMAGVFGAHRICVLIDLDDSHFDSIFALPHVLSSAEVQQLLQPSTHTRPAEQHDTTL